MCNDEKEDFLRGVHWNLSDLANVEGQRQAFLHGQGRLEADLSEFLELLGSGFSLASVQTQPHLAADLPSDMVAKLVTLDEETLKFKHDYPVEELWDDPAWQRIVALAKELLAEPPFNTMWDERIDSR